MLLRLVDRWARASQQRARRNAMLATTEAVRRRVERDEVAAYVAAVARRSTAEGVRVPVAVR